MKRFVSLAFPLVLSACLASPKAPTTSPASPTSSAHPRLLMTAADVRAIRAGRGTAPLFEASLASVMAEVEEEMASGIDTPTPRDYSGGYTHRRHKKNYAIAQKAGALYLILGEPRYANYVRDMLLQYAAMFEGLPLHPKPRSYARGKLFWQCLNDANWLVFMSQAYDAIHGILTPEERDTLEKKLFRPFADHISLDSPQFFNRIHNHSTWGTAAVGMVGLALQDDALVRRALYGLPLDEAGDARDDDGGFIREAGNEAGFFANLDSAFSPDGYYTEGPYYQRYAMGPFLIFAQGLRNASYREQAFERSDGVLLKAVQTLAQLSNQKGEFFALNDSQKGMSLEAPALVTAVDIAFQVTRDPTLLSLAEEQGRVLLDGAGFSVARALAAGEALPFRKRSLQLGDGRTGKEGGLSVLRAPEEALALVFKYTAQGLSHGHYDKLSFSVYQQGTEVLQDYGMVRFVNIGQKGGGNYLPENTSWSKQSIAHNTLVVDETSHFQGEYALGSQHHSELDVFDVTDPAAQVVSAREAHAYPGALMRRTMALLMLPGARVPLVLDLFDVESREPHRYDLPFHYLGQLIDLSFDQEARQPPSVLGDGHGYQHLYLEAEGKASGGSAQLTWMRQRRFYTLTTLTESGDGLLLARLGAQDANFNLRRDPVFILRRERSGDALFVSVIEPHGHYSPVTERATTPVGRVSQVKLRRRDARYIVVELETREGFKARFCWARASDDLGPHRLDLDGKVLSWTGRFHFAPSVGAP